MADALPPNQLVSASQIISQLAPVFAGSGTTTSSASTTSGEGTSQLENIINAAMANANNAQGQTQNVINNIMTQASQAFAPVLGQQSSAGMYNSNVLSMLSAMAQGQATSQSAKAVLDYQTSQQQLAESAAGKLASSNSTTSGTKATGPSVNPLSALGTLAGGVVTNKILNSAPVSNAMTTGKNAVLQALGLGPKQSAEAATTNMNHISDELNFQNSAAQTAQPVVVQGADNAALDGSAGASVGSGGGASIGSANIGADTGTLAADTSNVTSLGDASGLLDASAVGGNTAASTLELSALGGADAGAAIGAGVDAASQGVFLGDSVAGAGTIGGDLGLGITDSAAGIGDAAGLAVGVGPSVGVGDAIAGGDVLGAVSAGEGSIEGAGAGTAIADAGAAAWIICTELTRQKRMPIRFYVHGAKAFANYWNWGKCGYYIWAIPCVRHLRKKPNSKFSSFLETIFNWRAEYIAAGSGCKNARKLFRGRMVSWVLWSLCFVLAVSICQFLKEPDWQALGKETA